ncbi:MAG: hypothetical protein LBH18_02910 [Spirochaetaceae bacterium]|jgi:hypothetical protein|nr:hypothetical protein [Spirochaetaceae bacterium]
MLKSDSGEKQQYYQKKIAPFQSKIKDLLRKEESILAECRGDPATAAVKLFFLAERMLNIASNCLVINGIGLAIFNTKDEEALGEAKKFYSKALIYLENIVTGKLDAPFSDYEEMLAELNPVYIVQRYNLVKKLGLTCSLLKIAYGDNTKWRWVFVDMEGLCATVSKNLLDLKKAQANNDPSSPDYEPLIYHAHLVKTMLNNSADRFYARYSLSTKRAEDMRKAINFLAALNRIHTTLNERSDAEDVKKKMESWQNMLEISLKKDASK